MSRIHEYSYVEYVQLVANQSEMGNLYYTTALKCVTEHGTLQGIIILEPKDQGELHQSISDPRLIQPDVGIIVVDTINAHTRLAYALDKERCEAQFLKILMALQNISRNRIKDYFDNTLLIKIL